MLNRILNCIICCLVLQSTLVKAQDKVPIKFGKISAKDFQQSPPVFDSGAHAVVIADVGSSYVETNYKGSFGFTFERKVRIKIIDKIGLDAATFAIPVYHSNTSDNEESIINLSGNTYNLEGDKVVQVKLGNEQVYKDRLNRNWNVKKFTLPAVTVGSIIEVSYSIKSDFLFELRPWHFQQEYPCLWSEYEVEIPDYFDYVYLSQGNLPFHINKKDEISRSYFIQDRGYGYGDKPVTLNTNAIRKRWVMKNVPSLKAEDFISSVSNLSSKIEMQLASVHFPNMMPRNIMGTWVTVGEELEKDDNFGAPLVRANGWMDDLLQPVLAGAGTNIEKAKRIYAYVRDNYTCTGHSGFYIKDDLKTVAKNKSGTTAEINLLLTAMLKHEKLEAYPVILSTRSNGYTHELYPLMDRFNYVIAAILLDNSDYLLDASVPGLGFGHLPQECYNGHARVVMKEMPAIFLEPDSVVERKVTMAIVTQNEKSEIMGTIQTTFGNFESVTIRKAIREKGKEAFFSKLKASAGNETQIFATAIDSLNKYEEPIMVSYSFTRNSDDADILYIDPILAEAHKENIFKAASRKFPVEMPCKTDETYILTMDIPKGYEVEELPQSTRVKLNDDEGMFEYLISGSNNQIQLRTRIVFYKTTYSPEDYNSLREFFGYIVKKQSEQVVLKKRKS